MLILKETLAYTFHTHSFCVNDGTNYLIMVKYNSIRGDLYFSNEARMLKAKGRMKLMAEIHSGSAISLRNAILF